MGSIDRSEGILIASSRFGIPMEVLVAAQKRNAPRIELSYLSDRRQVYQKEFYIDGRAYDPDGIKRIQLNHQPLEILSGNHVYFSYYAQLDPGKNEFLFQVEDNTGKITSATLELSFIQPTAKQIEQRLKVALFGFESKGAVPVLIQNILSPKLEEVLKNYHRFNVFEREKMEQILTEQGIAVSSLANRKFSVRVAEIKPADLLLYGQVIDASQGQEIYLDIIDVNKPDEPIAMINVYHPHRELERLDWVIKGLYLKLADLFPLVEGKVIGKSGKSILTNLNAIHRIRPGSILHVYRQGERIIEEGVDYGIVEHDIGKLQIHKVDLQKSYARMIELESEFHIERGDYVISQ